MPKTQKYLSFLITTLLICFSPFSIFANNFDNAINFQTSGFEKNVGQIYDDKGEFRKEVHFVAQFPEMNIFFTEKGLVMYFHHTEASEYMKIMAGKINRYHSDEEWEKLMKQCDTEEELGDFFKDKSRFYRIDVLFPGANLSSPIGEIEKFEKRNYFHSNYPDGIHNVPLYEKIRYEEIFKGIDLVFYLSEGKLKYDFELQPNANPSLIKILYNGHQNVSLDNNGNAIIKILPGTIIEKSPYCYQSGNEVSSYFHISNDTIMFGIGSYDRSKPLTIDPALTWATYFHDGSTSAAFTYTRPVWDSNGDMYIVFNTYNRTTFPTINPGGSYYFQGTAGSTGLQLVIMKLNTSRQIIWATYYAGSASTQTKFTNQAVVIDRTDNLYVIGSVFYVYGCPCTLPLQTMGGYYETEQGNNRNFILKFSSAGTRLWATMFNKTSGSSSSGLELCGLAIDSNNKLVVTGETYTPPSWNPMPLVNPGGSYYYRGTATESSCPTLHRFTTGGVLEWSTYIAQGAASTYNGNYSSIALDASNNIFIANSASGSMTTVNPGGAYVDGVSVGNGRKISIFKFANTGALVWCTLYGGTWISGSMLWQDPRDIKVASTGDIFIVGRANATNFPFFDPGGGAFMKTSLSTGSSSVCDGVILKFSNGGVRRWATYYGGNGTSDGTDFWGMGIDGADNIYVSGISRSTLFPCQSLTGSYNQSTMTASYAIVLLKFNINGVRQWATYFGNQTWMSSGGFGLTAGNCGACKLMQMGTIENAYSITTLDPGSSAYYRSSVEAGTSTDIFAEFSSGSSGGGTPGLWTWLGGINDNWFEPCNWDKQTVPVSTSNVLIPGGTPNQCRIYGGTGHCYVIEVVSTNGANLTVDIVNGGYLEVHQ